MDKKIKINYTIVIVILIIAIISIVFYWRELRPSEIRKQCNKEATEKNPTALFQKMGMDYSSLYGKCLNKNGLEK